MDIHYSDLILVQKLELLDNISKDCFHASYFWNFYLCVCKYFFKKMEAMR